MIKVNINALVEKAKLEYAARLDLESWHGINHWRRVEKIGHYLADVTGADKTFISIFSYLHDVGRVAEKFDDIHGYRSIPFFQKLVDQKIVIIDEVTAKKMIQALEHHDKIDAASEDISVLTCWDADRLDLCRYDIEPNKDYLYTDIAKQNQALEYSKILNSKQSYEKQPKNY